MQIAKTEFTHNILRLNNKTTDFDKDWVFKTWDVAYLKANPDEAADLLEDYQTTRRAIAFKAPLAPMEVELWILHNEKILIGKRRKGDSLLRIKRVQGIGQAKAALRVVHKCVR